MKRFTIPVFFLLLSATTTLFSCKKACYSCTAHTAAYPAYDTLRTIVYDSLSHHYDTTMTKVDSSASHFRPLQTVEVCPNSPNYDGVALDASGITYSYTDGISQYTCTQLNF